MSFSQIRRRHFAQLMVATVMTLGGLSGCMTGASGPDQPAGTVRYIRGEVEATLANPFDAVDHAMAATITDLQFVNFGVQRDGLVAVYDMKTAEEKMVKVQISRLTDTTTKVEIRVETFGNERMSRTILEKIQAHL